MFPDCLHFRWLKLMRPLGDGLGLAWRFNWRKKYASAQLQTRLLAHFFGTQYTNMWRRWRRETISGDIMWGIATILRRVNSSYKSLNSWGVYFVFSSYNCRLLWHRNKRLQNVQLLYHIGLLDATKHPGTNNCRASLNRTFRNYNVVWLFCRAFCTYWLCNPYP